MNNLDTVAAIAAAQAYLPAKHVDCVVYHNPCNDGSGAALSAWLLLGNNISYERRMYHRPFIAEAVRGKNVVVLDASFKQDELLELRMIANKVMILDHHDSAMQELGSVPGCFFSMHNSGAVLAWHYFHGINTPPPKLLQLIEDRDLWRWQERELSEPLYYALRKRCSNSDFKTFAPYVDLEKLQDLINYGKTLLAVNHAWCVKAASLVKARAFKLPNSSDVYNILCAEIKTDRLVSELSEYLYTNHDVDFIMLWCRTGKIFKISFRSNKPAINVGAIATALGGGGHKQAAGVALNYSPWELTQ